MGTIKDFEDLEVWKMGAELVNLVYPDFRSCRDYGFKDQIAGAGTSEQYK
jgi:hypothetical protein